MSSDDDATQSAGSGRLKEGGLRVHNRSVVYAAVSSPVRLRTLGQLRVSDDAGEEQVVKQRQPLPPKLAARNPQVNSAEARLARIAGALASGATITEIAANEGISRVGEFVDEERELMLGLC